MKAMYTAVATATGGRNGHVESDNGVLDLQVRAPKSLGGTDDEHTNPEQLFAAGYAACFGSALNGVIEKGKIKTGETSITAKISIGQIGDSRYGLAAELVVNILGVDLEEARKLAEKAHEVCPYSNATKGNIEVKLSVTNV